MIDWLVAAGALAVMRGIFQSSDKKPGRAQASRSDLWSKDREPDNAWRKSWHLEVDWNRWIPQSHAENIAAAYPPPLTRFQALSESKQVAINKLLPIFAAHNQQFLAKQKIKHREFFKTIEASPLTGEQIDACICMDSAVQIVAAAGSGKTSTMVAKAAYVLREGLAKPEQILLLAFNTKAAAELRERIAKRLVDVPDVDKITVQTFHAFGASVLSAVNGAKPALAKWVGSPGMERDMIVSIVDDLRKEDPTFGNDWDIYRSIYGRPVHQQSSEPSDTEESRGNIRTARGDWVKSQEERHIADWLFFHGVDYEYEPNYKHDTRSINHRQYRPDFYYPAADLYHEHFAFDQDGKPPPHFEGDYAAGAEWKRACHREYGTELFETTSYSIRRGHGINELAAALRSRGVTPSFDGKKKGKGRPPMEAQEFAGIIRAFQQHAKSKNLQVAQLVRALESESRPDQHTARSLRFLSIYSRIAEEWDRRLTAEDCIDFDDMLVEAANLIETNQFVSPYTVICADEFQDSSHARLRLLKGLLRQAGKHGHLCVVGDDWQSINRFAGADASVMTAFAAQFPYSSQIKLTKTFRSPAQICEISSSFVSANPGQIRKSVTTTNTRPGPAISTLACSTTEEAEARVYSDLQRLRDQIASGNLDLADGQPISVLLLGRYRQDRPATFERWKSKFRASLEIEFRTIHAAKGLEADYVFILNMIEDEYGFPSQIADDPIMQLAMPSEENFPMAEERRIFYVALTRAKRQVRIYTRTSKPSRFLVELAQRGLIEIRRLGGGMVSSCPSCNEGVLIARTGPYGSFEACDQCSFKRDIKNPENLPDTRRVRLNTPLAEGATCPTCNSGRMVERTNSRKGRIVGCSAYPTCQTIAPLAMTSQFP